MVNFRDDSWLSVQKKFLPGGTIWDACDLTQVCPGLAACKTNSLLLLLSLWHQVNLVDLMHCLLLLGFVLQASPVEPVVFFFCLCVGHSWRCSGVTPHAVLIDLSWLTLGFECGDLIHYLT